MLLFAGQKRRERGFSCGQKSETRHKQSDCGLWKCSVRLKPHEESTLQLEYGQMLSRSNYTISTYTIICCAVHAPLTFTNTSYSFSLHLRLGCAQASRPLVLVLFPLFTSHHPFLSLLNTPLFISPPFLGGFFFYPSLHLSGTHTQTGLVNKETDPDWLTQRARRQAANRANSTRSLDSAPKNKTPHMLP